MNMLFFMHFHSNVHSCADYLGAALAVVEECLKWSTHNTNTHNLAFSGAHYYTHLALSLFAYSTHTHTHCTHLEVVGFAEKRLLFPHRTVVYNTINTSL